MEYASIEWVYCGYNPYVHGISWIHSFTIWSWNMFFARKSTIFVDFLSKTIPMPGAPVRIITCAELSHCQGLLQPRVTGDPRDASVFFVAIFSWSLMIKHNIYLLIYIYIQRVPRKVLGLSTKSLFVQLVTAPSRVRYLASKKSVTHGTYPQPQPKTNRMLWVSELPSGKLT